MNTSVSDASRSSRFRKNSITSPAWASPPPHDRPAPAGSKFYELSRAFHPDFYQNKSADEQTISLGNSALLNTAYRTLRDPIERAEYLLDLEAGSVKEIRNSPPADLFEEILELQDTLSEYRAAGRASETESTLRAKLQSERNTLEQRQQDMEAALQQLFVQWDTLQDRGEATEQARVEREPNTESRCAKISPTAPTSRTS